MSATSPPAANASSPPRKTAIVGWIFAAVFAAHGLLGVILPRLEKESTIREVGRGWHYFLGISIALLAIWLLRRWYHDGFIIAPGSLPPSLRGWNRMITIVLPLAPILAVPLGFLNAWGEGRTVHLAGTISFPTLMGQDRAVWQFAGYFHSALGNVLVLVCLIGLGSAGYSYLRYRKGLFSAFPPGIGFLILAKSTLFIYAINSFKEREPGYIAAGFVLALVGIVWLIGSRRKAAGAHAFSEDRPGRLSIATGTLALTATVLFAMFGPYLMFRVTPFATGARIVADPDISWHRERVADVALSPATQFEETVGMETYKWCQFCHTVDAGAKPLVGPNLRNIFGHRAGTVPNFYYSPSMAKAGSEGLVWNEETLDAFLANPDQFVPGTSMQISSGPVSDPKVRKAVINILKRQTMGDTGN